MANEIKDAKKFAEMASSLDYSEIDIEQAHNRIDYLAKAVLLLLAKYDAEGK